MNKDNLSKLAVFMVLVTFAIVGFVGLLLELGNLVLEIWGSW